MLVAKHIIMLATQHANGCLRENAVEPANNFIQTQLMLIMQAKLSHALTAACHKLTVIANSMLSR